MTKTETLSALATLAMLSRATDASLHEINGVCTPLMTSMVPLTDGELDDLEGALSRFYNWPSSQVRRAQFVATCETLYTALYERA